MANVGRVVSLLFHIISFASCLARCLPEKKALGPNILTLELVYVRTLFGAGDILSSIDIPLFQTSSHQVAGDPNLPSTGKNRRSSRG